MLVGTAAIICTAGAATPIVVIGAVSGASTIAYGTSNLIESGQDIYYGAIGDSYTVAINPIRDTVFIGNQEAYDIWGGVSTTVSGLVIPVGQGLTAAKAAGQTGKVMLGTVGKEVAKDFAQDAFVNAVSSGAGSAAMKVTGNANFSRAVSLASGVASGSKSGKVLNSLDDIGTSTVKSLNHLDDDYLDNQLGDLKGNVKINKYDSAESINKWWADNGYDKPPYTPKTVVQDITLNNDTTFVRVYDGEVSGLKGGWIMRAEDIKGLTPNQIQDKFALPATPKYIGEVKLKSGSTIRMGKVNPNYGFIGGGIQFDLKGEYIGEFKEICSLEDWGL